ncbi:MAG: hypothetical protein K0R54_563 [Clostridiaceae bacterium]|jgi:hypothetical protein|nr:hypothetical protein [Clostridiaceae bacterium]
MTININNNEYEIKFSERLKNIDESNNERIVSILNKNSDNISSLDDNEEFILIGEVTLSGYKKGNIILLERIISSTNVF